MPRRSESCRHKRCSASIPDYLAYRTGHCGDIGDGFAEIEQDHGYVRSFVPWIMCDSGICVSLTEHPAGKDQVFSSSSLSYRQARVGWLCLSPSNSAQITVAAGL